MGKDTLWIPMSLFWSSSSASNIYQGTNFPCEKASDSCDNLSERNVTHVTDTGRVINVQRYNIFSSDSTWIFIQFDKTYPSASPTNRISRLGDETYSASKKFLPRNYSDVSKCNGRQFYLKGFDKISGWIDLHN